MSVPGTKETSEFPVVGMGGGKRIMNNPLPTPPTPGINKPNLRPIQAWKPRLNEVNKLRKTRVMKIF